jgi:hypothetical protein
MRMITRSHTSRARLALATAVVCTLSVVALLPSVTQAAPSALPPRPTAQPAPDLPPRPTPEPVLPSTSPSRPPAGGFVELRVRFDPAWPSSDGPWQALWTVVQWQDAWGDWRNVVEWQGTLDEVNGDAGRKVWWVDRADFGKGPFRWVVYERRGGEPLAQSESFHLPHLIDETVSVEASLGL